jgi:CspA family cold shock protein
MGRQNGNTMTGTIKNVVADKGFGFILVDGGQDEYFFHHSACVSPLRFEQLQRGSRVQFVAGSGAKGPRAEAVSAI